MVFNQYHTPFTHITSDDTTKWSGTAGFIVHRYQDGAYIIYPYSSNSSYGVCTTPWSQYYSDTSSYHMNIFKLITDTEYTSQLPVDQSYGVKSYFSDIILINIDK